MTFQPTVFFRSAALITAAAVVTLASLPVWNLAAQMASIAGPGLG